nr:LOW QUALITY PROTEIN: V-set and transmembrane domain-containing protein 1 [Kogia breviceps]
MKSQTNAKFFPEKFSKSLLHALPSSEVEHSSNVTLKCQSDAQNVTFMLGKLQDPGYKQECNSTGQATKFLLTDLKPKDTGQYFCTCETVAAEKWELSVRIRLLSGILRGSQGCERGPPDTKVIFVATFSCLCLFLLFIAIFFIYRCAEREPAIPDFPSRELQVYPNWKEYLNRGFGMSALHARLFSSKPEESQRVTYVQLNTNALSEAASVPTEEPPGSCDYATLKVQN